MNPESFAGGFLLGLIVLFLGLLGCRLHVPREKLLSKEDGPVFDARLDAIREIRAELRVVYRLWIEARCIYSFSDDDHYQKEISKLSDLLCAVTREVFKEPSGTEVDSGWGGEKAEVELSDLYFE